MAAAKRAGTTTFRPRLRLLFDEVLSPRVARALHELDLNVEHVGGEGQPVRGSPDEVVLTHAIRCKQTIVTSNHDMIVLCCERRESVIWVDAHGKTFTFAQQVVLCFSSIGQWEEMLRDAKEPVCIQAMKTKSVLLTLERAKHLALHRNRSRRRRERRIAAPKDSGQGVLEEPDGPPQ
jgi:predicted nuclease of predicted toxin-antitoxin system